MLNVLRPTATAVILLRLCAALLAEGTSGGPTANVLRFDFETGNLQDWVVADGAFDMPVSGIAQARNTPNTPYPRQGRYHLSTVDRRDGGFDDAMVGVIESPVFALTGPAISFLVGGGSSPATYVALCDENGDELATARGVNSETMKRVEWNRPELVGRTLYLAVVDQETGGWGHVTLDDVTIQGRIDAAATARLRTTFADRRRRQEEGRRAAAARHEAARAARQKELFSDARLFADTDTGELTGERLTAVSLPVGGIGTGTIQIDGRAVRTVWQIFNTRHQSAPPHSFFAARIRADDGKVILRAMQTEAVGPFPLLAALRFRGEYPIGRYTFDDPALPVVLTLETFNPLIPLNVRDSSIPCAMYRLAARRRAGVGPVEVAFLAAQQNAVGFTGEGAVVGRSCCGYGDNRNEIVAERGAVALHLTTERDRRAEEFGDLALLVRDGEATATASWSSLESLAEDFGGDGRLDGPQTAGPSPAGETLDGAVATAMRLDDERERAVEFVLTWHFPNARHGDSGWRTSGNMYANTFTDALDVARAVHTRWAALESGTRGFVRSFYESNLPRWLLDRIVSQVAVLRSPTCFWGQDGYFGGWEGCGAKAGCCLGNCSHVWHYAQAHARLFPAIARQMRRQEFRCQHADGGVPHRQSFEFEPATDGEYGAILGAYREHLLSADRSWLIEIWPRVRRAMDHAIATWDADGDGVLAGRQWNTLDEAVGGSTSWLGSLYLASLAACERMAALMGDAALAARYRTIRESGMAKQDATLFNGEYYIQIPDKELRKDYLTGCHIDQVLGQWWAHQLGLGWLYPREHVRTALAALVRHNFRADFHGVEQRPRKFVADEDAGLQMITWPRGGAPDPAHRIFYASEVMSGFEYSAAAAMVQAGLLREGFAIVRAAYERYDGRRRADLTEGDTASWGYSGNPFGDDECGKFYARAMSVWSLLPACQGFEYDGPAGVIGFAPVWKPEDHRSFFTAAEGWGLFTQTRREGTQTNRLDLREGRLRIRALRFELPKAGGVGEVVVRAGDRAVTARHEVRDATITITPDAALEMKAGDRVVVVLR